MHLLSRFRRHMMSPLDRAIEKIPHGRKLSRDPWATAGETSKMLGWTRPAFTQYVSAHCRQWEQGIHWKDRYRKTAGGKFAPTLSYNMLLLYLAQIYGTDGEVYADAVERQRKINAKEQGRITVL